MADENQNTPPTFTDEQQQFINTIIDQRIGKTKAAADKAREEAVSAAVAEKEAEIARLNEALKGKGGSTADLEAARAEMKALLDAEKARTQTATQWGKDHETRANTLSAKLLETEKGQAIREAMDAQETFSFVDPKIVRQLVDASIVLDAESGNWVVKGENGQVRQNSSLQPMSVKEYMSEFAAQHPYLVKGQTKGGSGSAESRGGNTGMGKILTKADFKSVQERVDYINKFGGDAFEKLPAK